jgi:hypothetical protein
MQMVKEFISTEFNPIAIFMCIISQGTPASGGIPHILGNLKNAIWGNGNFYFLDLRGK